MSWRDDPRNARLGYVGLNVQTPPTIYTRLDEAGEPLLPIPPLGPGGIQMLPQEWGAPTDTLPPNVVSAIPAVGDYHLTLKYGLVPSVATVEDVVDALAGLVPPTAARVSDIGVFGQRQNCIVLMLDDMTWEERGGGDPDVPLQSTFQLVNSCLSAVPHVDSLWGYTPHVAMGYVAEEFIEDAVEFVSRRVYGQDVIVSFVPEWDFGGLELTL